MRTAVRCTQGPGLTTLHDNNIQSMRSPPDGVGSTKKIGSELISTIIVHSGARIMNPVERCLDEHWLRYIVN